MSLEQGGWGGLNSGSRNKKELVQFVTKGFFWNILGRFYACRPSENGVMPFNSLQPGPRASQSFENSRSTIAINSNSNNSNIIIIIIIIIIIRLLSSSVSLGDCYCYYNKMMDSW